MVYSLGMKKWTVYYRIQNGSKASIVIEAETRKDLFSILSRRGIVAISVSEGVFTKKKESIKISANTRNIGRIISFCVTVFIFFIAVYFGLIKKVSHDITSKPQKSKTEPVESITKSITHTKKNDKVSASTIAQEYNDRVKEFIKKKSGTNKVHWIVPPLDPNDPDNALRTRVAQELGSLLSIEPGEAMPPFPYSFMIEDDAKEAAANGVDVGEIDNGNKLFVESLKKWKIVAKETDDDKRIEHKSKILEAQAELLAGIDEGMSVNDSIRAAYEFRKRAYEMRSTIIKTLSEFAEGEESHEDTIKSIKEMNARLEEEGIKKINISEVIPDYEDEEEIK